MEFETPPSTFGILNSQSELVASVSIGYLISIGCPSFTTKSGAEKIGKK